VDARVKPAHGEVNVARCPSASCKRRQPLIASSTPSPIRLDRLGEFLNEQDAAAKRRRRKK
jgi:hypothetical protein